MTLTKRTIVQKRIRIGGQDEWVEREGNTITIRYGYAGRLTKDPADFSADDIRALASFVEETDND